MTIPVALDAIPDEIEMWGWGYVLTTGDERPHLRASSPTVVRCDNECGYVLRFNGGGGRACRNAGLRPKAAVVFPPRADNPEFSLVIDADATVDGDIIDLMPTNALLHRTRP